MLKYYLWAIVEKAACAVPLGKEFAYGADYLISRKRGMVPPHSSFRLTRKAKDLFPNGGVIMDVGTGWFHHDAFLLYLVGDYTIYLFDIMYKARLNWIKNYLEYLVSHQDLISNELKIPKETIKDKLDPLLSLKSIEEIYEKCHFIPAITKKTDKPFLPECSVDLMLSNCVLNHIPPSILGPELQALRKMLKKDGYMYHLLGHVDHWYFHDKSANMFNYYRYSDDYYRLFFENGIEYQNRMVKQEWLSFFSQSGLTVKECWSYSDAESESEIAQLRQINARFAKYSLEDLSVKDNYVLLQRAE
jgi:hypothetical protein